jgi:hypothetical protein
MLLNSPAERSSQPIYELQAQYEHNSNNNNTSNDNNTGKFPVDATERYGGGAGGVTLRFTFYVNV